MLTKNKRHLSDKLKDAEYLILVDLSNLAHRSYYGYPLMEHRGFPIQHIYGAIHQLINFLMFKTQNMALIFAEDGNNYWRKQVCSSYKANRTEKTQRGVLFLPSAVDFEPDNFDPVPDVAKITKFIPHAIHFKSRNDEADDVIAHIVSKYPKKKIVIFTSDKDLWQLTEDKRVIVWDGMRGSYIKESHLEDSFGVNSWKKIALYKSIFGDSSDGIDPCIGYLRRKPIIEAINDYEGCDIYGFFKFLQIRGLEKRDKKIFFGKEQAIKNYALVNLDGTLHSKLLLKKNPKNDITKLKKYIKKYRLGIEESSLRAFQNK